MSSIVILLLCFLFLFISSVFSFQSFHIPCYIAFSLFLRNSVHLVSCFQSSLFLSFLIFIISFSFAPFYLSFISFYLFLLSQPLLICLFLPLFDYFFFVMRYYCYCSQHSLLYFPIFFPPFCFPFCLFFSFSSHFLRLPVSALLCPPSAVRLPPHLLKYLPFLLSEVSSESVHFAPRPSCSNILSVTKPVVCHSSRTTPTPSPVPSTPSP